MKIATIFFIVGMLMMLIIFKTTFVAATQKTVDFQFQNTDIIISKSSLYLYMAVFFVILTLTGLFVSRRIHKVKRDKQAKNTTA